MISEKGSDQGRGFSCDEYWQGFQLPSDTFEPFDRIKVLVLA